MIRLSVLKWVPPFARGSVKEFRVRWALEEAGLAYEERVLAPEDQAAAAYRAVQPFGQVPVLEEDGFAMFESGAIMLRIAEKSDALMPADEKGRARTMQWVFAALTSRSTSSIQRRNGRRCAGRARRNSCSGGSGSFRAGSKAASGWKTASPRATW
jgi:glutathione S-transferase